VGEIPIIGEPRGADSPAGEAHQDTVTTTPSTGQGDGAGQLQPPSASGGSGQEAGQHQSSTSASGDTGQLGHHIAGEGFGATAFDFDGGCPDGPVTGTGTDGVGLPDGDAVASGFDSFTSMAPPEMMT
jgi:hypothetical protein